MPKFIGEYSAKAIDKQRINEISQVSPGQFGVITSSIYYDEKDDTIFCISEGPNKKAIKKHYKALHIDCDCIVEVDDGLCE